MNTILKENLNKLNMVLGHKAYQEVALSHEYDAETHYKMLKYIFNTRYCLSSQANKFDAEYLNFYLITLSTLYVDLILSLFKSRKSLFNSRKSKLRRFNKIIDSECFGDVIDKKKLKSLKCISYIYENPFNEYDLFKSIKIISDSIWLF